MSSILDFDNDSLFGKRLDVHPMTAPQSPTAPAPEVPDALLAQWVDAATAAPLYNYDTTIANRAAAWAWAQREEEVRAAEQRGADQELEAVVTLLRDTGWPQLADDLLRSRRPSPPTLREQALAVLADDNRNQLSMEDVALIREALQEGAE